MGQPPWRTHPNAYAEEMGLSEGAAAELKMSRRRLVLTPVRPQFELKDLVAGITPQNRHGETDWGEPVGKET